MSLQQVGHLGYGIYLDKEETEKIDAAYDLSQQILGKHGLTLHYCGRNVISDTQILIIATASVREAASGEIIPCDLFAADVTTEWAAAIVRAVKELEISYQSPKWWLTIYWR
jgi:hypothetical protein